MFKHYLRVLVHTSLLTRDSLHSPSENLTNKNSDFVIPKEESAKLLDEAPDGGEVEDVPDTGKVYYVRRAKL